MSPAKRLLRQDWAVAALEAIADHGIDGLSVERLAKSIGVTKGSCYWHFADRAALILAAAEEWERRGTIEVIAELSVIDDPRARLRAVFLESFGDSQLGPIDAALAGRGADELIGPVVKRATATRLDFLTDIFTELGCAPLVAAERSRIAYSTYLGHFQMLAALTPHSPPSPQGQPSPPEPYLNHLVAVLTTTTTPGEG